MSIHGSTVRSPLTGCQVTSRPLDRFSRYSKWLDTFRTALTLFRHGKTNPQTSVVKNHVNEADVAFSSLRTIIQNKNKQNTAQDNFKYERTKTRGSAGGAETTRVLPNVGRIFLLYFYQLFGILSRYFNIFISDKQIASIFPWRRKQTLLAPNSAVLPDNAEALNTNTKYMN